MRWPRSRYGEWVGEVATTDGVRDGPAGLRTGTGKTTLVVTLARRRRLVGMWGPSARAGGRGTCRAQIPYLSHFSHHSLTSHYIDFDLGVQGGRSGSWESQLLGPQLTLVETEIRLQCLGHETNPVFLGPQLPFHTGRSPRLGDTSGKGQALRLPFCVRLRPNPEKARRRETSPAPIESLRRVSEARDLFLYKRNVRRSGGHCHPLAMEEKGVYKSLRMVYGPW